MSLLDSKTLAEAHYELSNQLLAKVKLSNDFKLAAAAVSDS